MKGVALLLALAATQVQAQVLLDPLKEYRVCPSVVRTGGGKVYRSKAVIRAYREIYPCPVTGQTRGACPGWAINHVIPLSRKGCDAVINLQWVPDSIKSCAKPDCIDRWERDYYTEPRGRINLSTEDQLRSWHNRPKEEQK